MRRSTFDPIEVEILWNRLIGMVDEAAIAIVRTAFSTIVRDSNDYACVLLDGDGNCVAENTGSIPSFAGILPKTVKSLLQIYPRAVWKPGDVVVTNDPWLATGHRNDTTVVTPIFHRRRLVGFAGSVAHKSDVGGLTRSAEAREVFEEGIGIPPLFLFRRGRLNTDLVKIIETNVRIPHEFLGDLHAQSAACSVCAQKVENFLVEQDLLDLRNLYQEVANRSEAAMRRSISEIPDGEYGYVMELDGYDRPLQIRLNLVVNGSEISVDYTGTAAEVNRGINCVLNYTYAYTAFPLKCILDPHTPKNEGSFRPISVHAPLGSVLNPRFPAPVAGRMNIGHALAAAVYGALSKAIPSKVMSDSGSPAPRTVLTGVLDDGTRFARILFFTGGMGARPGKDGLSTTAFPTNSGLGSVESIESISPYLRIWRKELIPDSGGPGEFRGGLGQEIEMEFLGVSGFMALTMERVNHPPQGFCGGLPGGCSATLLNGNPLPPKTKVELRKGDRILVRTPGGGGYGLVADRSSTAINYDVRDGYVSETGSQEVHDLLERVAVAER